MKKLLSLVLSFALVCTLISGCGPKGGGGNSSNQPLDAAETTFGLTPLPDHRFFLRLCPLHALVYCC